MRRPARPKFARVLAAALALAIPAGCESSPPGAGFTNPNAGSMTARDKAAVRNDLPAPSRNAGPDAPIVEAVASKPADSADAGSIRNGTSAASRPAVPGGSSAPNGTPPSRTNAGQAQGGTKPAGPIQEGTPRGPQ